MKKVNLGGEYLTKLSEITVSEYVWNIAMILFLALLLWCVFQEFVIVRSGVSLILATPFCPLGKGILSQ